jgi:hypothetical protein
MTTGPHRIPVGAAAACNGVTTASMEATLSHSIHDIGE